MASSGATPGATPGAPAGLTTEEQQAVEAFQRDIVTPSMDKLVILDFWAEWCGPCKELTPVLEKVAGDYADKNVILAKVNVDENKFIASQFQVRSIPTVYAMFQGQPVADLTPARTEPQLTQMLDQLLEKLPLQDSTANNAAADVEPMIAAGEELLAENGAEQAHNLFAQALSAAPENTSALSGLIRALLAIGDREQAQAIYDSLTPEIQGDTAIERAKAALAIAAEQKDPAELAALTSAAENNPGDHQARFDLANAQVAAGERDMAADNLLHIIAEDAEWNDSAARTRLLEIFEMIGLADPWVSATRRRLSAILFG